LPGKRSPFSEIMRKKCDLFEIGDERQILTGGHDDVRTLLVRLAILLLFRLRFGRLSSRKRVMVVCLVSLQSWPYTVHNNAKECSSPEDDYRRYGCYNNAPEQKSYTAYDAYCPSSINSWIRARFRSTRRPINDWPAADEDETTDGHIIKLRFRLFICIRRSIITFT